MIGDRQQEIVLKLLYVFRFWLKPLDLFLFKNGWAKAHPIEF